jgi:hypothetical protein
MDSITPGLILERKDIWRDRKEEEVPTVLVHLRPLVDNELGDGERRVKKVKTRSEWRHTRIWRVGSETYPSSDAMRKGKGRRSTLVRLRESRRVVPDEAKERDGPVECVGR